MQIINAHSHMIEIQKVLAMGGAAHLTSGIAVFNELKSTLPLLSVDVLLKQMDEAGVSKSVLFAVDAPIVYSSNEYVSSLCKKYPDRFIGFASVNPLKENAVKDLERAVKELGLKGLKLHPPLQKFYTNDPKVFPVYEKALELNIPVVFHVGTTPFGSLCCLGQADPMLLDDVAVRYPDLRILITHLGTLYHHQAFMVVEKNPNVYIDTAAYLYEIKELLTENLINRVGKHKFIFGTDYPMPYVGQVHRIKDFTDCMKELKLPEPLLRGIFSENFENFMKPIKKNFSPADALKDLMKFLPGQKTN